MLLFFISRLIFYFLNTGFFPGISGAQWGQILAGGLQFDLAAMFYFNALYIFSQLLPLKIRHTPKYQQVTNIIFIVFNSLAFLVNCVDMIYFRFTLRRSTMSVFTEFAHEENKGKFAGSFLFDYWYVILIFLFFVFAPIFICKKLAVKPAGEAKPVIYYPVAVFALALGVVLAIGGIRGGFKHSTRPITMSNAGEYVSSPSQIPLVLNTPFCLVRTYKTKFYQPLDYFGETKIDSIYNPVQTLSSPLPFRYDNVVIIILESFGKDAVGFYNHDLQNGTYKGFTPFLDSLLSVSKVSTNSFANGRKSIDALPSILAGIPTGEVPFVLTPYAQDKMKTLPDILRSKGYNASFFHGASEGSMGFKAILNLMGVNHYYGKESYNNDKDFDGLWGIWDEPFFQYFGRSLDTMRQPFISTIFSVSSHHPFKVPEQYQGKFPKGDLPIYECMGYTDMALRNFFGSVKDKEWFKHTLFVLSADHASVSQFPEYKTSMGDMSIPILFFHYGDSLILKDNKVIQQTDIMPSVLGFLHYNGEIMSFGKNVFDSSSPNLATNFMNGYRQVNDNYVLEMNGGKPTGLFKYDTDKLMQQNLLTALPAKRDSMQQTLKAYIQQYNNRLLQDRLLPGDGK